MFIFDTCEDVPEQTLGGLLPEVPYIRPEFPNDQSDNEGLRRN